MDRITALDTASSGIPRMFIAVSGRPPQGIDIGERISRSDLAINVWVIHSGSEKIDGLHQRLLGIETKNACIVSGVGTDDDSRVTRTRLPGQDLPQGLLA